MKKYVIVSFLFVFILSLLLTGCITRDSVQISEDTTSDPDIESVDAATPTPEPTPAPLDYSEITAEDPPEYGYCENDSDVFDALERIRVNPASKVSKLSGTSISDSIRQYDKVSVSGDLICLIADKDLLIVRAAGEESEVMSRTHVGIDWSGESDAVTGAYQGSEKVPAAVFCAGDRAVILSDRYGYKTENGVLAYTEYISADFYDISDPADPKQISCLGQSGSLVDAFIDNGNLILITEYQIFDDAVREEPADFIPSYFSDDTAQLLPGDRICVDYEGVFCGGAVIGLYDQDEGRLVDIQALMGVAADACISEGMVLFHSARHAEAYSRDVVTETGKAREIAYAEVTDLFLYRTDDSGVSLGAVGAVCGTASDSGCMDIHDGTIRCLAEISRGRVTEPVIQDHAADHEEGSALIFLNDTLETVGSVNAFPDGSRFSWAGFAGDRILLTGEGRTASCVYNGTDWGEMVSGGTAGRYIRKWGENGLVVFDQNNMGRLTISICDISGETIASKSFGSDHSSTLENNRAYIADEEANLLTFTADDSFCVYGYSAEKGIELIADIYLNDWAWNAEGIRIGDLLYIVDSREVKIVSTDTFEEIFQRTF